MYHYAIKALKTSFILGGSGSTAYAYTHYKPINIIWDLDHTLIHTIKVGENTSDLPPPDFIMTSEKYAYKRYGYMRPGAYHILKFFSMCGINQYVFTAATKDYAQGVLSSTGIKNLIIDTIAREDVPIQPEKIEQYFNDQLQTDIIKYNNTNDQKELTKWGTELVNAVRENDSINQELLCEIATSRAKKISENYAKRLTMRLCGKDIKLIPNIDRFILIDDNIESHKNHENTGILIPQYRANKKLHDYELFGVAWVIFKCFFTEDITGTIKETNYSIKI